MHYQGVKKALSYANGWDRQDLAVESQAIWTWIWDGVSSTMTKTKPILSFPNRACQ
jgi:hypothetical protein